MMKQPLFGQDSSPHYTSRFFGYVGTVVLWMIFIICMIFIKPAKKEPEFKTVQIVLEPLEKQAEVKSEGNESTSAAAPAQTAVAMEEPVSESAVLQDIPAVEQPEPIPAPAIKTEPVAKEKTVEQKQQEVVKKSEPVKKQKPVKKSEPVKQPDPYVPPVLSKSVDELMQEQLNQKKQNKEFNWDAFDDDVSELTAEPTSVKKVTTQTELSGAAAKETLDSAPRKYSSENLTDPVPVGDASNETNSRLKNIASQTAEEGSKRGGKDNSSDSSVGSSGTGIELSFSDGNGQRAVIYPTVLSISLSEKAKTSIRDSIPITVTISIVIQNNGHILTDDINFTRNGAMLTPVVKEEIKNQVSKWFFDEAEYVSTAKFEFKIVQS